MVFVIVVIVQRKTMNDKSQVKHHANKPLLLEYTVMHSDEGYQTQCPTCPWTSGIKTSEVTAHLLYYKHLEFIGNLL